MNFKAHANCGVITGYCISFIFLYKFKIEFDTAAWCILSAVLGSILPDLDSDYSKSFNFIMTTISFIASLSVIIIFKDLRFFPVSVGVLIFFETGIKKLIRSLSKHRGVMHSIIALLCCSLTTVLILKYFGIVGEWFIGVSLGIGFFSHLLLDEINSLYDFKEKKFVKKKSFGTACKLYSKSWSGIVVCGIIIIEIIILIMGEL